MRPLGKLRPTSPIALRADSALREGRAWEASRILETALRDSAQRTPELILLAAAAAAAWEGWEHAADLLDEEVWVDSLFGGAGRALLARSALEMDRDTIALAHAERAVASGGPEELGGRLVLLARALHRLERRDSARVTYERAAEELPSIADWLRLRAAGLARAERDRAATYTTLRLPAAVVRAPAVEAQARERYGDLTAAARAYEAVGDRTSALRSRVQAASARGRRTQLAALRREMYASVRNQPGTPAASAARTVLDAYFTQRSVAEELLLAHAAFTEGDMSRAAAGFGRAARAGRGRGVADSDRFTYGRALLALGRERAAAVQFARVRTPRSLAGQAAYERARALLRLDRDREARTLLRRVVSQYGSASPATPSALYLLADLATDERRDGAARAAFRELATRFPTAPEASTASFRAALIAFVTGDVRTAAREFDSLAAGSVSADERASVVYWSGRAWQRSGDTAAARALWQSVLANAPQSYYALVAARRLGVPSWAPARAPGSGARTGDSARPVPAPCRRTPARARPSRS